MCYVCSAAVLFVPVYSYRLVMDIMPRTLRVFLGFAALSVILVLSPVESRNKKLDDAEKIEGCIFWYNGAPERIQ